MGRATVVDDRGEGLYLIRVEREAVRVERYLEAINSRIEALMLEIAGAEWAVDEAKTVYEAAIAALNQAIERMKANPQDEALIKEVKDKTKAAVEAQKTWQSWMQTLSEKRLEYESLKKKREEYETIVEVAPLEIEAWCADLTEGLTGEVAIAEVPGELQTVQIRPGYDGRSNYSASRDGHLKLTMAQTPAQCAYNYAMLAGWQRWRPRYRYGVISAIDEDKDTCDVLLDPTKSAAGININPQGGESIRPGEMRVDGWADFAARNPDFPLANSGHGNSKVPYTAQLMADLATVNNLFNNGCTYKSESGDRWDILDIGGSGDCEDFALGKAARLLAMGYPASAIHIEVGLTREGQGHAWLIVQTEAGDFALDINYRGVVRAESMDYIDRQRQTGMNWYVTGVALTNVPIEYMDCDSDAFDIGDHVLIEFNGQSWDTPKVIGFKEAPKPCAWDDFIVWDANNQAVLWRDGEERGVIHELSQLVHWQEPYPWISLHRISDNHIYRNVRFWDSELGWASGIIEVYERGTFAKITELEYTGWLLDVSYISESDHYIYTISASDHVSTLYRGGGYLRVNGEQVGPLVVGARVWDSKLHVISIDNDQIMVRQILDLTRDGQTTLASTSVYSAVQVDGVTARIAFCADKDHWYLMGCYPSGGTYEYLFAVEKYDKASNEMMGRIKTLPLWYMGQFLWFYQYIPIQDPYFPNWQQSPYRYWMGGSTAANNLVYFARNTDDIVSAAFGGDITFTRIVATGMQYSMDYVADLHHHSREIYGDN